MANEDCKQREAFLKERIDHLEKVNRETLVALSLISELADLKTSLNQVTDISIILKKANSRLHQLIEFGHTAFYTFDEGSMDLDLAYTDSTKDEKKIHKIYKKLVDDMHVAKCINGTKPIFITVDSVHCVLYPLFTASRVRGLFLGTLEARREYIADSMLSVFTVILGNTANMLEGFELYGLIRDMNIELEDQITELAYKQKKLEREVNRRKLSERDLRDSQRMLEMVMENIPQHVFWKNTDSIYMGCNKNFAHAAGLSGTDDIIGKTDLDLPWATEESNLFRDVDKKVIETKEPLLRMVESITMHDGKERLVETNKVPLSDETEKIIGILGTFHDITNQKAYEKQLTHQAFHDALTDLPNRALVIERIDRAIRRAQRDDNAPFAVILLDLDRFKYVNDSLGHLAGDRLLVEMGQRLADTLRSVDTVARLGGDEFAILLEGFDNSREVIRILHRILKTVQQPFTIHGNTIHSTTSVGVVLDHRGYTSPEDILRDADVAMYTAKNRGGAGFKVYTESMRDTVLNTATLQNDLITGLSKDEFFLEYQPIFDITGKVFMGAEALVRWNHPVKGRLGPNEFIPIAEDTGLIVDMGKKLLDMACDQAMKWRRMTDAPFYISVNISGKQLRNPKFISKIQDALTRSGLPADTLALEVTETVLMDRADATLNILRGIKDLGIRLFLDDFGTGYSSLSYLQQFPVDTIKIDRCFVKPLGVNGNGQNEIVKAVMALAQSLNMTVIAEGVEEKEQLDALSYLHCQLAQGYYYAKPMPADDLTKLLLS